MLDIISIVMLGITAVFSVIIAIAAINGLCIGWKRAFLGLVRVLLSVSFALLLIKAFTNTVPAQSFFSDMIIPLAEKYGFMGYIEEYLQPILISHGIQTMSASLLYTLILPIVFVTVFCIIDLIMRLPMYIIGKVTGCYGKTVKAKKKKVKKAKKAEEAPALAENSVAEEVSSNSESTENSEATATTESTAIEEAPTPEPVAVAEEEPEAPARKYKIKPKHSAGSRIGGLLIRAATAFAVLMIMLLPTTGLLYTFTDGITQIADTAEEIELEFEVEGAQNLEVMDHLLIEDGKVNTHETTVLINETLSPIVNNFYLKASYSGPMRRLYTEIGSSKGSSTSFGNEISQIFDLASNSLYLLVDMEEYGDYQKDAVEDIIGYISDSELHSEIAADIISNVCSCALNGEPFFGIDLSFMTDGDAAVITTPALEAFSDTTAATVSSDLDTVSNLLCAMIDHDIPAELAKLIANDTTENLIGKMANEDFMYVLISEIYNNEDFHTLLAPSINFAFTVVIRQFDDQAEPANVANNVENLSDADLHHEAELFALILSDAAAVIDNLPQISESGSVTDAVAKANMTALGSVLDNAFESNLIGDGMHELFVVMLRSPSFDSMRSIADTLESHIYDENLIMKNLLVAVQEFSGILSDYESAENKDVSGLAARMRALSSAFDPTTTVIIKEIINDSSILGSTMISGGSDSVTKNTQKILNVFVDQLASGELTEEEIEEEAKAVDYAMQLINTSTSEGNSGLKDIYNNDSEGMSEMIDTLADSKIASASINAIAYDEEGNLTPDALELKESTDEEDVDMLISECEKYYKEETAKEDCDVETLETNLKAIAAIFGEDISADLEAWKNGQSVPETPEEPEQNEEQKTQQE